MEKTLFYNFLPLKAAKNTRRVAITPRRVTSQLIEIRDDFPPPVFPTQSQPTLTKVVKEADILTTKLTILHHEAFDYLFRYWSMPDVENVLAGHKHYVTVRDNTGCDDGGSSSSSTNRVNEPHWYNGPSEYIKKGDKIHNYYLNLKGLYRSRRIRVGDSIELRWDVTYRYIHLKVVPR
ncbi:hypothetical protein BT93_D1233 [Corymbia citriodora subsp. variegata]|nr:hypothetical protein BT93_D1233 [Corymbia citriodora subsp. variegata]